MSTLSWKASTQEYLKQYSKLYEKYVAWGILQNIEHYFIKNKCKKKVML